MTVTETAPVGEMMARTGRPADEEQLQNLAYQERLRVTREVHDLVGHGLTVINMQAGIALHVAAKRPDQAEAALAAIKSTCETVLEELRGTLAVFRQPPAGTPAWPVTGLDQLDALVAETRAGGLPVELVVAGERPAVPGAVELAAFRIVQESLTNVIRHAGRASVTVRVRYSPRAVGLEIIDDGGIGAGGRSQPGQGHGGTASSGGHGVTGMRERAAALGGSLEAGPRRGGGFRVRAWLPVGRAASHGPRRPS